MTLDDPDLLGIRCSTLRSSLGEDLDNFFPKFDESLLEEVHDNIEDTFFDHSGPIKVQADQLQKMLTVENINRSDNHHHQRLAQELCLENKIKTVEENNLFVDKFNTFNADELRRMLAPLQRSLNHSDLTIPLKEDECKVLTNQNSSMDSTVPYTPVTEETVSCLYDADATVQYDKCEENIVDIIESKKRKLSTVIENLAKRMKFDH